MSKFKTNKLFRHIADFPYIFIFFLLLGLSALLAFFGCWTGAKCLGLLAVAIMTALLLTRPMNAVYGLMGTTGSIRLFFSTFLLFTITFAAIYQLGFFQDAGITYDVNQPHIDFDLYEGRAREPLAVNLPVKRDTVVYLRDTGEGTVRERVVSESGEELRYQPIDFWFTLRNTILTALMQEPADFFSVSMTHNAAMDDSNSGNLDRQKAEAFQWLLIFQVLISWIFFGVFISLLYNKFRHES